MENCFSKNVFCHCIKEIHEISRKIKDGWNLKELNGGIFIIKESTCFFEQNTDTLEEFEENLMCEKYDESNRIETNNNKVKWEYHIVYNESYNVPMLCFNIYKSNGELVTLSEMWNLIRDKYNVADVDLYQMVTQMDHPVLQKPFFSLHPCKTDEILKAVVKSKNPVISWWSTIGSLVGLNPSIEYYRATIGT